MKYLIKKYQVVYVGGCRDTINLNPQILTVDPEAFRMEKKNEYPECIGINLTYIEVK